MHGLLHHQTRYTRSTAIAAQSFPAAAARMPDLPEGPAQAIGYGHGLNRHILPSALTHSGSNFAASLLAVENVCCIITGASRAVLVARLVVLITDGVADLVIDQVLPVGADVTLERHRAANPARLIDEARAARSRRR